MRNAGFVLLQRVADVGKVELVGLQDEKVWIELSNTKLATLGIPMNVVQQALDQPLPDSPMELEPEIAQISMLLCLYQTDSSKMTKH